MASNASKFNKPPVVVVIATCGKERVKLLLGRALLSVQEQINLIDRVVVVSDNDVDDDLLSQSMIRSPFNDSDQDKVVLLHNTRTRRMSGTGAWNTGIMRAFEKYGKHCWVAILDDDDKWNDDHVKRCLDAAQENGDGCMWVASGILRKRSNGKYHEEPIPERMPSPKDFFSTNPGIQGSNLFVKCGLLVEAGMFDEALPSTTDRDLCIRLCDLLQRESDDVFASTRTHTVIHYAVRTHNRVSAPGSPAKIDGLKRFYYKFALRMDAQQRAAFRLRAKERFGCNESEFQVSGSTQQIEPSSATLLSWSGEELKLNRFTNDLLPPLEIEANEATNKKDVMFGIISGDIHRLGPLLEDLGHASKSRSSDFRAFVIVFANAADPSFAGSVRDALESQGLRGFVLDASNDAVPSILRQSHNYSPAEDATISLPLPICLGRTVLQVFIFRIAKELASCEAVVILDDDKRLPMGWSPFRTVGDREVADIQIGRDLRTPPNPTLLSLRTNLLDVMYAFDLAHFKINASVKPQEDVDDLLHFFNSIDVFADDKFDWY